MACPLSGARFSLSFARGRRLRHEIYIDGGSAGANASLFDALREQKGQLAAAYGRPLTFEDLPDRASCRIADYRDDSDVATVQEHGAYVDWFVDFGDRFRRALGAIESS